ncbi:type II/IV secretion system protein [Flavobacterium columnare NBRC 100251 = ATCC 23463]|uniref:Type II/IV secretion system protein n=1 Tax=Flavobacterium columnare TaxID=996 RepID=A0AAI8CHA0_9FLAO|nr:GspE/PulE family protein [Flavobacterium columnare]AMO20699.1 type II/IV secretion system protein [Flavobacterium columnare]ANO47216.1 type II secretion system protein E [Flavobacterium columnare]APT22112.1 general secretion pathway protein GspE [Flavobacterium columnare]AUX18681.1 general secretion pathway protein GspE [Flavobacterium columnare]MBF6656416.1 type II/IV secretion system protein [Flavobacterium columnare]
MDNILDVNPENILAISSELANHYRIIPKQVDNDFLQLYIDTLYKNSNTQEELELLTGKNIKLFEANTNIIEKALSIHYRKERIDTKKKNFDVEKQDFLESLLEEAKVLKSSDIHFEVYEDNARIRLRIDGQLIERYKIQKDNYLELVNKVKIKAKLNITEKRLPQDGRITNEAFDIRVSILPTLFGEKIVMRLLGQDASNIDLNALGFKNDELEKYLQAVKKPNGIILISGPTGSGKTTTLYATLKLLNDSKRNIVTVEDPIEYTLKGINQVQLKEDIGLTFASALKSFLRQDPDVIMLGEIRDSETALMAIRASLTGHLVLSTIHTNSAIGTMSRLIDMGVPAYLISETLNLSVAQRLVRKLCENCKQEVSVDKEDFPMSFHFPYPLEKHFKTCGCNQCFHTGYKGRTAIYEVIHVDNKLAAAIKHNNIVEIFENDKVHQTLAHKAFDLLAKGETSLDEIYPILIAQ